MARTSRQYTLNVKIIYERGEKYFWGFKETLPDLAFGAMQ
jgi:hypothetical protein